MSKLFSGIFPGYVKEIQKMTVYADLKKDARDYSNFIIMFAFIFGVLGFILGSIFLNWIIAVIIFAGLFVLILFIFYIRLVLQADKRAREAENSLPDALQLMATNLRAGLTTDKAFLVSAREEFGSLNFEFKKVAKEIATGKDLSTSLSDMSKRIRSNIVARTIDLIIFGITSGGELASLLEESASSLRQQLLTKKQIHSSVFMYTIFIFIAVGFISPFLFSLSTVLTEIMGSILGGVEAIPTEVATKVPLAISAVLISSSFIKFFAITLIIISAILSSLVLGLINSGEEKDGLKYIPFLIVISLSVFFLVKIFIKGLLSFFF